MLTPKELKEFAALWAHLSSNSDDNEGPKHDKAHSRLQALRRKATQILTCCDAIQHYPIVTGSVSEDGKWRWGLNGHSELYSSMNLELLQTLPEPKFCPFCATDLPKMVRHNLMDAPVGNEADVDYCSYCHERIMCCICLNPTANWITAGENNA